jgi:hypothetical protein
MRWHSRTCRLQPPAGPAVRAAVETGVDQFGRLDTVVAMHNSSILLNARRSTTRSDSSV